MRLYLLILLFETTVAHYSSADLRQLKIYFKGPFLDNLDKVVDVITTILSDGRKLGKLKMSEIDEEDNNEDLRKQTAAILKTALAKDFLRENLRDLQLDNTLRKERLTAVVDGLPDTDLGEKYKNYIRHFGEIEKRILELFSPNREVQTHDLYTNLNYTAESLLEEIIHLMSEKNLVRRVLESNKYTDAIFLNFYHIFRNHAMLLSIACTAQSTLRNVTIPSKRSRVEELTSTLTMKYGKVLVAAKAVNAWRDTSGFQFDDLFSEDQLNRLQNYYAIPHPDHLNEFVFTAATESMKSKYYYFAIKNCDNRLDKYQHPAVRGIERLPRFTCDSWVFRYPLEKVPNTTNTVALARKFKKRVASALEGAKNYNELSAAKLIYDSMNQTEDVGLLTVVTTRNPGSIIDDIYSVPGGFKVIVDFDVTQSAYTEKNIVRLQVIGYFITINDF